MKKAIALILLVTLTAMLLVACAPQKSADEAEDTPLDEMDVKPDLKKAVTPKAPADDGPKIDDSFNKKKGDPALREDPYEPAVVEPEPTPEEEPAKTELSVTKEELDELRMGIEGISAEDLGGLEE